MKKHLLIIGMAVSCCMLFFFQAEDGIRDLTVTGVQTCALPIFSARDYACSTVNKCPETGGWRNRALNLRTFGLSALPGPRGSLYPRERVFHALVRSEERRVGEECRSRWSPYPLKKKQRVGADPR